MDIISSRYAQSLFELAKEEQSIEVYQEDIMKIQAVFQDESFVRFFSHVAIADDIKFDVIKKSFQNQVSQYVFNFLLLLIKRRRMKYILGICHEFESLCHEYFGIKVGKVYTAFQLSDEELMKIEKAVGIKVGKEVKLRMVIDDALIGGIKVDIDNHIYDDSLLYKLESLKNELLRK